MTEEVKEQLKEKIITWLNENIKLGFTEVQDNRFHFSFLVWGKQPGTLLGAQIAPIQLAYLKQLHDGHECILAGWGWPVDFKNLKVKSVMDNPKLRDALVQKLRQIINDKFKISFLPNDNSFSEIKVFALLPVNQVTKEILDNAIIQPWLKFATVCFQFEKQFRWPAGSDDPSKYI